MIFEILAPCVFQGLLAWALYIAAAPFVRRVWPNSTITSRRLLEGRLRDPSIGLGILTGAAMAQFTIFARFGFQIFPSPAEIPGPGLLESITGMLGWTAWTLDNLFQPVFVELGVTVLTLATRQESLRLAVPVAILLFTTICRSILFSALRFGLLALVPAGLYAGISDTFGIFDPSSWYFGYVMAYLVLILLPPLCYAFWISLSGKKLVSTDLQDS